jgi:hypothetical protein
VNDTTEKVARKAYLQLSPRDKTDVDPWLDLGNSYFDSLINSGVLTKTRTNPEDRTRMSSRGAREVFHDLPWQHKNIVGEWLATGHDLPDALLSSNVLGTGEPITPLDAWREELRANDRQQTAHHEAAHSVAAYALGLKVQSAKIKEDGSGSCIHTQGTKLQNAVVIMAPELWIGRFRRDLFPHGPTGLKADHRALAEIGDTFILRTAMDHCMEILKQNREIVLETADRIARGNFRPW